MLFRSGIDFFKFPALFQIRIQKRIHSFKTVKKGSLIWKHFEFNEASQYILTLFKMLHSLFFVIFCAISVFKFFFIAALPQIEILKSLEKG